MNQVIDEVFLSQKNTSLYRIYYLAVSRPLTAANLAKKEVPALGQDFFFCSAVTREVPGRALHHLPFTGESA
ncbi:hypothetical protein [Hymenobacter terricola]|uniref:hypothetical protein n=1 Tax=Hymenobacter terricola TaxID=2819236 RepID=UPI001B30457A|nr:hypothetical protein [Hymenobacter terricola]